MQDHLERPSQGSTGEDCRDRGYFGFSEPVRGGCLGFSQSWGHIVPFCTSTPWFVYLSGWIAQEAIFLAGTLALSEAVPYLHCLLLYPPPLTG